MMATSIPVVRVGLLHMRGLQRAVTVADPRTPPLEGAVGAEAVVMATSQTPSLFSVLLAPLEELVGDNLQKFKKLLMNPNAMGKFGAIRRCKLQTECRSEILQTMLDQYGVFTVSVIRTILKEIGLLGRVLQDLDQSLQQYPQYEPEALIAEHQQRLQTNLKKRFERLQESVSKSQRDFKQCFTEIFMVEADTGLVIEEHEVIYNETLSRPSEQEKTMLCQDLFTGSTETGEPIRVVLTKGVAGVGKTVLTQKFSLDWAEGRSNENIQNIHLLFHITFRELNLFTGSYSLVELLHLLFRETTGLCSFQQLQLIFILDGLDEFRLRLDFNRTRVLTESTESTSVQELLVNLIRGDLLPSALLWITTRPAAANQIPAECVSMTTEVRGFTDPQKEQYFMKRFRDEREAAKVLSHIKKKRSLDIMCRLPVFCWILSDVLKHLLKAKDTEELPTTFTQMYIHFLVVQVKVLNHKFFGQDRAADPWTPQTIEMVHALGKLAFEHLQKENLIFYESDLIQCRLDMSKLALYSVFTQIFREEPGQGEVRVYSFIHLTVQEFLAALHVHQIFFSSGENLLSPPQSSERFNPDNSLSVFYRSAVDRALQSPNGQLDMFLRFLLGLSRPKNQNLLKGLLKGPLAEDEGLRDITNTSEYISEKLEEGQSVDRTLNLLYCRNELCDGYLAENAQYFKHEEGFEKFVDSNAVLFDLAFVELSTNSDLEHFNLRRYEPSEMALKALLVLVKVSTTSTLSWCNLSPDACGPLASVLKSSSLDLLDLSHNPLKDSGVKLLCEGLQSAPCRLSTLRLRGCGLTDGVCGPLASVLRCSSLTVLDVSDNDVLDSGVELLCEGLKSATCRLETLRLSGCMISERGGACLASALSSAHSHLRRLDLRYNCPGASTDLLTALQTPLGPLQQLRLDPAGERFMVPGLRKYCCDVRLDPIMAQRMLLFSEDHRRVRLVEVELYPDHPDRFTEECYVMSCTGPTGRRYWEVALNGSVQISYTYRNIRHTAETHDSELGEDNTSWALTFKSTNSGRYCIESVNIWEPEISFSSGSNRVAIFLDFEAGELTFCEVLSDERLLCLRTFCCDFSEPLLLCCEGSPVSVVNI